jgi:hypothetical protein
METVEYKLKVSVLNTKFWAYEARGLLKPGE